MPEIAPRQRQTEEYYFSRKLREIEQMNRDGEKVIRRGIGSPDLPPHPEVVKTLCNSAGQSRVHGYQDRRSVVSGRRVPGGIGLGGRSSIKKKQKKKIAFIARKKKK